MNVNTGKLAQADSTVGPMDTGALSDCVAIGVVKTSAGQTERMVFHVNGGLLNSTMQEFRQLKSFIDGTCKLVVTFGTTWLNDKGAMQRWQADWLEPLLTGNRPSEVVVQSADHFRLEADGAFNRGRMPLKMGAITPGFVQALRAWGQYLAGARDWGWGPFAARQLLDDAGLDQIPTVPPTREEAEAFAVVAKIGPLTPAQKFQLALNSAQFKAVGAAFDAARTTVEKYLERECSTWLDEAASNRPANTQTLEEVLTAVTAGLLAGGPGLTVEQPPPPTVDRTYWDQQVDPATSNDPANLVGNLPERNAIDYRAEAAPPAAEETLNGRFGNVPDEITNAAS